MRIIAIILVFFAPASVSIAQTYYFDDNSPGFSVTGSWSYNGSKPGAYLNDHTWSHFDYPGNGSTPGAAFWTFSVPSGRYNVLVHWHELGNRAQDAKYQVVYNGSHNSGDIVLDQRNRSAYSPDSEGFVSLGEFINPTQVTLSNQATQGVTPPSTYWGFISADAVKIIRVGDVNPVYEGKAYIPKWYIHKSATDVWNQQSFFFISNITDKAIPVIVTFKDQNGDNLQDDNSPTSGKVLAYGSITNYSEGGSGNGEIQFTLPAHGTVHIQIWHQNIAQETYGYGTIQWSTTETIPDGKALIAQGHVIAFYTSSMNKESTIINGGLPF